MKIRNLQNELTRFGKSVSNLGDYRDVLEFFGRQIMPCFSEDAYMELIFKRSYVHPNGWKKIVLIPADEPDQMELRVHIYEENCADCSIHNHAWNFHSMLLCGEVLHEIFDLEAGAEFEMLSLSPLQVDRENGELRYVETARSPVSFQQIVAHSFTPHDVMFVNHRAFHRVTTRAAVSISIVLQMRRQSHGSFVAYRTGQNPILLRQPQMMTAFEFRNLIRQICGYAHA